jgi:uncharacterized protein YjbI with pentapeptide repeats
MSEKTLHPPKLAKRRHGTSLQEFGAMRIEPDGSYDTLRIATDVDSRAPMDADWRLTVFLDCVFDGCRFDMAEARDVRMTTVDLCSSSFTKLSALGASMFEVGYEDCRIGAFDAMEAVFHSVEFVRCKIGYMNLRGAKLRDVVFRDCEIEDFDAADATLTRVSFNETVIGSIAAHGASLSDVDLRQAHLREIRGIADLAGVTMSPDQVTDLAVPIAKSLGILLHN